MCQLSRWVSFPLAHSSFIGDFNVFSFFGLKMIHFDKDVGHKVEIDGLFLFFFFLSFSNILPSIPRDRPKSPLSTQSLKKLCQHFSVILDQHFWHDSDSSLPVFYIFMLFEVNSHSFCLLCMLLFLRLSSTESFLGGHFCLFTYSPTFIKVAFLEPSHSPSMPQMQLRSQ